MRGVIGRRRGAEKEEGEGRLLYGPEPCGQEKQQVTGIHSWGISQDSLDLPNVGIRL